LHQKLAGECRSTYRTKQKRESQNEDPVEVDFSTACERTTTLQFETLATGYGLLEGPRIDERNRLYYSDARNGGVFRRSPDGSIETLIAGRKMVGEAEPQNRCEDI